MTDEAHDQEHEHEIVIIKRHGGHEDAHHGGVWKIAFADFMTAMMAFFLVMWLISANDKTKATIAKYFNPVELVDSTPQPRGINDAKAGDPSIDKKADKTLPDAKVKDAKPDAPTKDAKPDSKAQDGKPSPTSDTMPAPIAPPLKDATAPTAHDEAELTRDPYAVLADIATSSHPEPPVTSKKPVVEEAQRGMGSQGNKGGEAFRDPFEPPMSGTGDVAPGSGSPRLDPTIENNDPIVASPPPPKAAGGAASKPAPEGSATAPATEADKAGAGKAESDKGGAAAAPPAGAAAAPAEAADKPLTPALLRARIAALGKGPEAAGGMPKLDVRKTDEGLLISLTDSADFSMFPSASARPAARMVALVEKIGELLKTQKGTITVRGFTDSRPFRSDTYDNWRLSAARAQMAHYMLVRGGLSDERIDRIEGYADRRPKNPKDPLAPENRRIEILLRDTTP